LFACLTPFAGKARLFQKNWIFIYSILRAGCLELTFNIFGAKKHDLKLFFSKFCCLRVAVIIFYYATKRQAG